MKRLLSSLATAMLVTSVLGNGTSSTEDLIGLNGTVARSRRAYGRILSTTADDFGYRVDSFYPSKPVKGYKVIHKNGDVYEVHKYQHYGFKKDLHKALGIAPLLALLAPLATLPIVTSAFTTTMASVIPTITTTAGRRRRRRDAVSVILSGAAGDKLGMASSPTGDDRDLGVIQKYLRKVRPDGDYNDEVVATYLRCSGMLERENGCLERLVCQFSQPVSSLSELEKEVASLIIYAILTNKKIDIDFKGRLRKSAFLGRDQPTKCSRFICPKSSLATTSATHNSSSDQQRHPEEDDEDRREEGEPQDDNFDDPRTLFPGVETRGPGLPSQH